MKRNRLGFKIAAWAFVFSTSLLFAGTIAIWVRSQFHSDQIDWIDDYDGDRTDAQANDQSRSARRPSWASGIWNDTWTAYTNRAAIFVAHYRSDAPGGSGSQATGGWHFTTDDPVTGRLLPTFKREGQFGPPYASGRMELAIPYWLLMVVFGIVPIHAGKRLLIRAPRAGHCQTCGYDLRATPGRCPECGREG